MMSEKKICRVKEGQPSGDVDQKIDLINTLSCDALAKVFMQLPIHERIVMDQVCSRWKEASKLAWYDIKKYKCTSTSSTGLAYDKRLLTQSDVEKILLHCGMYLKELSLSNVCKLSILPIVGDHCKNLSRLEFELSEYHITANSIDYFVQAFKPLEKLKIVRIQVHTTSTDCIKKFPNEIINSLPEGLDEIHIFFPTVPKNTFFFNLKKFKNLHSLTLSRCNIKEMIAEISKKQSLIYLNLDWSKMDGDLIFMFNQLVNLEHISMISFPGYIDTTNQFTPGLLASIFNTCKYLKHLDIPMGLQKPVETSIKNWANLKNLKYLNTFWEITDDVATEIVNYCKNLEYLCISSYNSSITERAFKKLTELKNLETFKLEFLKLSSRIIIAISNNCKKLKHLSMLGCTLAESIDDGETRSSASALDDLSKLQFLEHLDFLSTKGLQDSTIIAIANKCKNLKYLGIGDCQNITETALMALTSMENLEKLEIWRNPNVTNNFIVKLKGLKWLNCTNCKKLTDAGLIQLMKNCPDLEELNIDARNITKDFKNARDKLNENRIFDIRVKK